MANINGDIANNKLILLYIISKEIDISANKISSIVIKKNIMDYFSLQIYLNDLINTGLIYSKKDNHQTYYSILDKGLDILNSLKHSLAEYIVNEIDKTMENYSDLDDRSIKVEADYTVLENGKYLLTCGLYDLDLKPILKLELIVDDKKQALNITTNWRTNTNKIYADIMSTLIE